MKAIGQYIVQQEQLGLRTRRCIDQTKLQQEITIKCLSKYNLESSLKKLSIAKGHLKFRSLKHINLLQYRDFKESRQNIYIISEFVQGRNLEQIVRQGGSIDQVGAIQLIQKLVACLNYLSEKKIFHYDIKPTNILVSNTGEVKVLNLFSSMISYECEKLQNKSLISQNIFNENSYVSTVGAIYYYCIYRQMPQEDRGCIGLNDHASLSFIQLCLSNLITWKQLCNSSIISNQILNESIIINQYQHKNEPSLQQSEISFLTNSECDECDYVEEDNVSVKSRILDDLSDKENKSSNIKSLSKILVEKKLQKGRNKSNTCESWINENQADESTQISHGFNLIDELILSVNDNHSYEPIHQLLQISKLQQ